MFRVSRWKLNEIFDIISINKMEYAILRSGGKQYRVLKDSVITVERLHSQVGEIILLDDILLYVNKDGKIMIGKPRTIGVKVKGTVLEHSKGEKIRIAKFKAKAKYRRVTGHRQYLTKVKIDEIKAAS